MEFEDLKNLYLKRLKRNPHAYEEISDILEDAKGIHQVDFLSERPDGDHGQSWRAWKGKNFERLVHFIVSDLIKRELSLETVQGSTLERRTLDDDLSRVKRNILVDFGDHGCFVPDADIVVYDPSDYTVRAIISCKITLRERIAQTGFWKLKLEQNPVTENIKVFFVTPDEDDSLAVDKTGKPKAIAVNELDATYALKNELVEHYNIKNLHRIIEDLR